jgi:hypothetical protein
MILAPGESHARQSPRERGWLLALVALATLA